MIRLWQSENHTLVQLAQMSAQYRHDARLTARAMMGNWKTVAAFRARSWLRFGHPDGPSFAWLKLQQEVCCAAECCFVTRALQAQGFFGDEALRNIIATASLVNVRTNAFFGVLENKKFVAPTSPVAAASASGSISIDVR